MTRGERPGEDTASQGPSPDEIRVAAQNAVGSAGTGEATEQERRMAALIAAELHRLSTGSVSASTAPTNAGKDSGTPAAVPASNSPGFRRPTPTYQQREERLARERQRAYESAIADRRDTVKRRWWWAISVVVIVGGLFIWRPWGPSEWYERGYQNGLGAKNRNYCANSATINAMASDGPEDSDASDFMAGCYDGMRARGFR